MITTQKTTYCAVMKNPTEREYWDSDMEDEESKHSESLYCFYYSLGFYLSLQ